MVCELFANSHTISIVTLLGVPSERTGYEIYNGATPAGSTTGETTYTVNELTPGTAYNFTVKAKDAAGNLSEQSNSITVNTKVAAPEVISADTTIFEDKTYDNLNITSGVLNLNGHKLIVNGRLLQSGGTIYVNSGQLLVKEDYLIQTENKATDGTSTYIGSKGYLKMISDLDYVQVGGNFVTQSYYNHDGYLTAGVMEVKGDFTQKKYTSSSTTSSNFYGSGTHKVILNGTQQQKVTFEKADSRFNTLEIKNYSQDGISFITAPNAVTLIDNGCKISYPGTAVTGWSLTADETYEGDLYLAGGTLDLSGHTLNINGSLIQAGGTVLVNGGRLNVAGDYRLQTSNRADDGTVTYTHSSGYLQMINEADYVSVGNSFITDAQYTHNGMLTAGTLEVKGDFIQTKYSDSDNFKGTGTHRVLLSGTGLQTLSFETPGSTATSLNILEITNSSQEGVKFETKTVVAKEVRATASELVDSGKLCLAPVAFAGLDMWNNDVSVEESSTLVKDITIQGSLYVDNGTINLNGYKLNIGGKLIQSGGTVYINKGQLLVKEDYFIQTENKAVDGTSTYIGSKGYLKMISDLDYVQVGGRFVTQSYYSHNGYLTAGEMEVKGDFTQKKYSSSKTTSSNFYGSGTHKVLLNGTLQQKVTFETAYSRFNILELTKVKGSGYEFNTTPVWNTLIEKETDNQAPTAPGNLQVTMKTGSTITFTWSESQDNDMVKGYEIYRNGVLVGNATSTEYMDYNLTMGEQYSYIVKAFDSAHNLSDESNTVVETLAQDIEAPTTPENLKIVGRTDTSVSLLWDMATDNINVVGYNVYRNSAKVKAVNGTNFTDSDLIPGIYEYQVEAYDISANTSPMSNKVMYDNKRPEAPVDMKVVSNTLTSITLEWTAVHDDSGIDKYEIFRNGTRIGEAKEAKYSDSELQPGTSYNYTIKVYDVQGNISLPSSELIAETLIDTEAPAVPQGLKITAVAGTAITLGWTAASDNVAVAGYEIYRDNVKTGDTKDLNFKDTGLETAKAYMYHIKAYDGSGNFSQESSTISIITLMPSIKQIEPTNGVTIGGKSVNARVYVANCGNMSGAKAKLEYSSDSVNWSGLNLDGPYAYGSTLWYFKKTWDLSTLESGNYNIRYTVSDSENNMVQQSAYYQIDRTPPAALGSLSATGDSGSVILRWSQSGEGDVIKYKIYKSASEDGQ